MEAKKLKNIKDLLDLIANKWQKLVGLVDASDDGFLSSASDVLLVDDCPEDEVIKKLYNSESMHIVSRSKNNLQKELNVSALMLCSPETFFKFPVASIFHPEDSSMLYENKHKVIEYEFSCSADKYKSLILFEVEMEKMSLNESAISTIRSIADELFTNAIYNAPNEKVSEKAADRKVAHAYEDGKKAKLFIGKDDNYILIGCTDPYGSLDTKDFVERLYNGSQKGVESVMNMDSMGGAGIGTYMMFESSVNLYVGVEEGVQTTVMCMVPYKISSRKLKRMTKNLHFLKINNKEEKGG